MKRIFLFFIQYRSNYLMYSMLDVAKDATPSMDNARFSAVEMPASITTVARLSVPLVRQR